MYTFLQWGIFICFDSPRFFCTWYFYFSFRDIGLFIWMVTVLLSNWIYHRWLSKIYLLTKLSFFVGHSTQDSAFDVFCLALDDTKSKSKYLTTSSRRPRIKMQKLCSYVWKKKQTRPDVRHKMRLVGVLFTFENNTGHTDRRTDGRMDRRTDGHDHL